MLPGRRDIHRGKTDILRRILQIVRLSQNFRLLIKPLDTLSQEIPLPAEPCHFCPEDRGECSQYSADGIFLHIIGKFDELPYDIKTLREDAHANAEEIVA